MKQKRDLAASASIILRVVGGAPKDNHKIFFANLFTNDRELFDYLRQMVIVEPKVTAPGRYAKYLTDEEVDDLEDEESDYAYVDR